MLRASETGNAAAVKALLVKGTDVEIMDVGGTRPIHNAAKNGFAEIVQTLIEAGAEIEAEDGFFSGFLPLTLAAYFGRVNVVKTLLGFGANPDGRNGKKIAFSLFQAIHSRGSCNDDRYYKGQSEIFDLLVAAGASIEADNRNTLLHSAASVGNAKIVETLLKTGQSPHTLNEFGETPLHRVGSYCANEETIRLLLKNGADREARDNAQNTPFLSTKNVLYSGDWKAELNRTMNLFVRLGANINAQDRNGNTLLHIAVIRRYELFVKLLLKLGAWVGIENADGKTPLDLALAPPALPHCSAIYPPEIDPIITVGYKRESYFVFQRGNMQNIQALLRDAAKK